MMYIIFGTLLLVSLFVERTLVTFPLIFVISFAFCYMFRNWKAYGVVLLVTLIYDAIQLNTIGITPLLLFIMVFIVSQENVFIHLTDIKLLPFLLFFFTSIYSFITVHRVSFIEYIVAFGVLEIVIVGVSKISNKYSRRVGAAV